MDGVAAGGGPCVLERGVAGIADASRWALGRDARFRSAVVDALAEASSVLALDRPRRLLRDATTVGSLRVGTIIGDGADDATSLAALPEGMSPNVTAAACCAGVSRASSIRNG